MTVGPNIRIREADFNRLASLVESAPGAMHDTASFLRGELDRAAIVADDSKDCVQMGSRVSFRDHTDGRVHDLRLVYPTQSDPEGGCVSVLTPVGSALLGLQTGATMQWRDRGGRTKELTVLSVGMPEMEDRA